MNIRCVSVLVFAAATCALSSRLAVGADTQEPSTPKADAGAPATTTDPAQLSHGAQDILKLSRAKVGDDVIVAFIKGGNRRFELTASEIVQLRNEGVSDRVLAAMVNKESPAAPPPSPPQPAVPASAASVSAAPDAAGNPPAPAATVYVVPTSAPYSSAPYAPYPYYYGYSYPAVSVGFAFGTGWGYGHYGGYGGCYRGGGYYGGHSHGGHLTVVGGGGGGRHR